MKQLLLAAALCALCVLPSRAAWWAENDYSTGSNGVQRDSLTLFTTPARNFTAGLNTSFYKDNSIYKNRVYSFRLPLMYSGPRYFVSFKPFLFPEESSTHASAYGGKLYLLTSLSEENDESYLHLVLSGAWARQSAWLYLNGTNSKEKFYQSAYELQAEKSFYNQFFFQASAAGFTKPDKATNANVITPALDQSELAYLGIFRQVTELPEWVLTAQVARNMRPEFESHIYAGYSKISYRRAEKANSAVVGFKLNLNEKTNLDLAYNAYKEETSAWKNYYKLFLQLFF